MAAKERFGDKRRSIYGLNFSELTLYTIEAYGNKQQEESSMPASQFESAHDKTTRHGTTSKAKNSEHLRKLLEIY